jgi:argininosuccinate lyase
MTTFLLSTPNKGHLFQVNKNLLAENTARTQNEQNFEMDKKQMQTTIHNLNEQLKVMRLEMEKLKLNQKPCEITSQEEVNDYGDLADDTKWVWVQNSKKKGCWSM